MVKAYLRYSYEEVMGGLSQNGGVILNNIAYSIVAQYIMIVDLKTQTIVGQLYADEKNVEIRTIGIKHNQLAAGYADGEICIFDITNREVTCRLMGHQSAITQLLFLNETTLISGSCDTSIVLWDVIEQQLQLRMTGHTNEITSIEVVNLEDQSLGSIQQLIVTSSKDGLLKVWDLNLEQSVQTISSGHSETPCITIYDDIIAICSNVDEIILKQLNLNAGKVTTIDQGAFKRQTFAKILQIKYLMGKLYILNNEKKIEVYRLKTKAQKKLNDEIKMAEMYTLSTVFTFVSKIIKIEIIIVKGNIKIVGFTKNNGIETKYFGNDNEEIQSSSMNGTLGPVRQLCLTQFDQKLLAIASKKVQTYDCQSNSVILEYTHTEELTALALLPKNRFYLCGDAGGNLLLLDLTSNECLHELKIHEKAVNNIVVHDQCKAFNGLVIMTTEVNRKVNFLELFLNKKTQKIELAVVNSVYLKEDIRNAAFTNNGEMYAISLLNNNIQIYYCNTHKLFLELYGHSLPIVSFDITSDDDMLISGGSDKSIKVWAMDFGNCKKTLKAHQAEVSQIKTVKDTHYFFSAGKDFTVRYWDGDTFQLVMQFNESLSNITSISVGCIGDLFYVGTKDGLIRKYTQSKEQVFVQDEEEKRIGEQLATEIQNQHKQTQGLSGNQDMVGKDLSMQQIGQRRLQETEELMNILEQIQKHRENEEMGEEIDLTLFCNSEPNEYLFKQLERSDINALFKFLHQKHYETLINEIKRPQAIRSHAQICSNIVNYILNRQDGFGLNSHETLIAMMEIRERLQCYFKKEKKQVGFNLEYMQMMLDELNNNDDEFIFE